MNSSRGIFEPQEGFAPAPPAKSPFAVADEGAASSPFAVVSEPESPFASLREENPPRLAPDPNRPVKLPERRPVAGDPPPVEARSPFAAEAMTGSPFEAPVAVDSPFATAAPVSVAAAAAAAAPFAFSHEPVPAPPAVPVHQPVAAPAPVSAPPPLSTPPPVSASASFEADPYDSDSRTIRQLELRAIFGVDRELSADEILQRARALPGIRHVSRIPTADNATIDAFKRVIGGLGFAGQVKLYCGSVPIEFVREGGVMLAVQNDGTFAPGVRETLMIVARELGKL
ncbi:hypothetical protein [Luteolibacter sp. Populi]|uniref:hypothetical protein n=1 Tax=Luteolibacter sp. Populi TaxID=3230487 RepID=UPI0034657BB5